MAEVAAIASVLSGVGAVATGISALRGPKGQPTVEPTPTTALTDPDAARRNAEARQRAAANSAANRNSNVLTGPQGLTDTTTGQPGQRTALGR